MVKHTRTIRQQQRWSWLQPITAPCCWPIERSLYLLRERVIYTWLLLYASCRHLLILTTVAYCFSRETLPAYFDPHKCNLLDSRNCFNHEIRNRDFRARVSAMDSLTEHVCRNLQLFIFRNTWKSELRISILLSFVENTTRIEN